MKYKKKIKLTGLTSVALTHFCLLMYFTGLTSGALTPLIHMTNHCHKTIHVNESLILDLTENLKADRVLVGHLSCAVTLHAPPGARLYLHVLQLAISDKASMPDRYTCTYNYCCQDRGKLASHL